MRTAWTTPFLAVLALAAGCAVNPVTGQRELSLLSTADEISMGESQYQPYQQAAGGRYQVDPTVTEYVAFVGQRVAAVSDRPLPYEFVVINEGTPNAWALPGGKVGVHRGLLVELDNEAELAAVLGHEVVHAAAKHGAQGVQRGLLFGLAGVGIGLAAENSKHAERIVGAANLGLHLVGQKYGREQERVSDYHGMKYMHVAGYDTMAAVTLQQKFVALSEGRRNNWLEGMFASHPPSPERVANNRAALAEFPPGGELGRERYQERIATLLANRSAYEAADRARQDAAKNPVLAMRLIDEAIEEEPREAQFHGIKGEILASQGRYQQAVEAYDAAIKRDTGYFGHYLGRGLARDSLGEKLLASGDIARSNSLFPTPLASYKLGAYALAEGQRPQAKRLFEVASQGTGNVGRAAADAFVRLDIEDSPARYVVAEPFFEDGKVVVELSNVSDYHVADIVVRVRVDINGETAYRRLSLGRLAADSVAVLDSRLFYRDEDEVKAQTRVLEAAPGW